MQPTQRNIRRLRWLAVLIVPCLGLLALGSAWRVGREATIDLGSAWRVVREATIALDSAWMLGRDDTIEIDSSDLTYRFIRIKYDGLRWDDGMDSASRADINFLDYFHKVTGFKTASQSEALAISSLARYPKGYAPPMVYMTGDGKIDVPDRDVQIMRDYLMSGGMLFADCGSRAWHGAFTDFIRRVFPEEILIRISDDDIIFQAPFPFENGVPPLWHHGGRDALGINYKGRWVVFYHPGDLNDAWKNNRGGFTSKQVEGALEMGVNLVYYSHSNYQEINRKYRRVLEFRNDSKGPSSVDKQLVDSAPLDIRWTRYPLASVKAFDGTSSTNRALELIRRLIRPGNNLFAAVDTLGSIPYSVYDVSLTQDTPRSTIALMLDVRDAKTLVLIFGNGEDMATCPLLDSLLLTVESNRVTMLLDAVPRSTRPCPADFRRALSWYSASFEPMDKARVKALQKRAHALRAEQRPVVEMVR